MLYQNIILPDYHNTSISIYQTTIILKNPLQIAPKFSLLQLIE